MKTCTGCQARKTLSEFTNHSKSKDGKQSWCKSCYSIYDKDRAPARKKYQSKVRGWVQDLKKNPCQDCKRTFHPAAMDFHHIDPATKLFPINNMTSQNKGFPAIKQELEKCVLLCANCHRIRHAT